MDEPAATVTIVEEEPAVARSVELVLEEEYAIRTASDGETALDRIDDVDVVLLDRMMPGLSRGRFSKGSESAGSSVASPLSSSGRVSGDAWRSPRISARLTR